MWTLDFVKLELMSMLLQPWIRQHIISLPLDHFEESLELLLKFTQSLQVLKILSIMKKELLNKK